MNDFSLFRSFDKNPVNLYSCKKKALLGKARPFLCVVHTVVARVDPNGRSIEYIS